MKFHGSAALVAAFFALTAVPAAAQEPILLRFDDDAALSSLLPSPSVRVQARAGNHAWGGSWELSIATASDGPAATAQRAWKNGQIVPFRLTYDGFGYLSLDVGGQRLARDVQERFSAIALRVASQRKGASLRTAELQLNHTWIGLGPVAQSSSGALDVESLLAQGVSLATGFVLRGELCLAWTQQPPQGDQLVLDVWLGDLPDLGQDFCTATPNSSGQACDLDWSGMTSLSADVLRLAVRGGVPKTHALFLASDTAQALPFGNGWLCVGPTIVRLSDVLQFDATGALSHPVSLNSGPLADGPLAVVPGAVRTFQLWYRDPQAPPAYFNLSDGLALTFVP